MKSPRRGGLFLLHGCLAGEGSCCRLLRLTGALLPRRAAVIRPMLALLALCRVAMRCDKFSSTVATRRAIVASWSAAPDPSKRGKKSGAILMQCYHAHATMHASLSEKPMCWARGHCQLVGCGQQPGTPQSQYDYTACSNAELRVAKSCKAQLTHRPTHASNAATARPPSAVAMASEAADESVAVTSLSAAVSMASVAPI